MSAKHYQLLGGGLFPLNSNFLRMDEPHRSGADSGRDLTTPHPPGRIRGSKSDLDARNCNVCFERRWHRRRRAKIGSPTHQGRIPFITGRWIAGSIGLFDSNRRRGIRPNQGALAAFSFLDFVGRFGSGCVLRTASVSISRNSALVFGGSRVGFCH